MSTEEPAWKAELMGLLDEHFISSSEEIFDLVLPHIQAAEERGRWEAARMAREAASEAQDTTSALGPNYNAVNALLRIADRIDPGKEKA